MKELTPGQRLAEKSFSKYHYTFLYKRGILCVIRGDGFNYNSHYSSDEVENYFELLD